MKGTPDRAGDAWTTILGIMSGTSADGADFVVACFGRAAPRLARHWHVRFPRALRDRILSCAAGQAGSWETARLHHDLGRFYAGSALKGLGHHRVDAVGLHGQTVFHGPGGTAPATLQLGEAAYLTEALGVPVVGNFRAADLAANGQGAPLATLFHLRVFGEPGRHICVQNLGGMGNVTSLEMQRHRSQRIHAFDTGPANVLLDGAMARLTGGRTFMDRDGRLARRGRANEACLERWLRHPFFHRPPPKSTGREEFGAEFLSTAWKEMTARRLRPADRLATLTELTARSVVLNYRLHLRAAPDRVVLCGGGVRNGFLVERLRSVLRAELPGCELRLPDESGWPAHTVEGAAFALLARECLLGRPGNLPSTTGARRAVVCGQVSGAVLRMAERGGRPSHALRGRRGYAGTRSDRMQERWAEG